MELLSGESLDQLDPDISLFLELNLGTFIRRDEMDGFCLDEDFSFDPLDFIEDIAFLCLYVEDEDEKTEFLDYLHSIFEGYWDEAGMSYKLFLNHVESARVAFLIV